MSSAFRHTAIVHLGQTTLGPRVRSVIRMARPDRPAELTTEDTMQRYLSFGYLVTIVGGLLLAGGSALALTIGADPFSARVVTTTFAVSAALRLLGAIAIIIGVTAIYVRESSRAGTFGLVAYLLVIVNMVLQAGTMWSDLFVTGALATHAPEVLDGTVSDARLDMAFLTAWVLNSTFVLLGIATLRARVFPRLVGWMLILMGAITVIPLPFDGPVFEVVIGAACAVAGFAARRVAPIPMDSVEAARVLAMS
jgi:hypothetical protein